MGTGKFKAGGNIAMDHHPIKEGVGGGGEMYLVTSCYRSQEKLWPDGPIDSLYADFTLITLPLMNQLR